MTAGVVRYMTQNTVVENRCPPPPPPHRSFSAYARMPLHSVCVTCNRGLWTGIFWGLFQMCIIPGESAPPPMLPPSPTHAPAITHHLPGNVAAVYILSDCNPPPSSSQSESLDYTKTVGFSGANTTLFIVLSLAGAAGCLVFLTLRSPDPK